MKVFLVGVVLIAISLMLQLPAEYAFVIYVMMFIILPFLVAQYMRQHSKSVSIILPTA